LDSNACNSLRIIAWLAAGSADRPANLCKVARYISTWAVCHATCCAASSAVRAWEASGQRKGLLALLFPHLAELRVDRVTARHQEAPAKRQTRTAAVAPHISAVQWSISVTARLRAGGSGQIMVLAG